MIRKVGYFITKLGLDWKDYKEVVRSNEAREAENLRHNLAMEAETNRSNLAKEALTGREIDESIRSNKEREKENALAHRNEEKNARLKVALENASSNFKKVAADGLMTQEAVNDYLTQNRSGIADLYRAAGLEVPKDLKSNFDSVRQVITSIMEDGDLRTATGALSQKGLKMAEDAAAGLIDTVGGELEKEANNPNNALKDMFANAKENLTAIKDITRARWQNWGKAFENKAKSNQQFNEKYGGKVNPSSLR